MKNAFDEALAGCIDDEGLSGIGSSLRKIGRKIDKVRRKITPKIIRKIEKEVKRFLSTDLGKVVAVVIIVVATVYGLGPVVLEAMKTAIINAGAFVKDAVVAGAKYVAKQGAKKIITKQIKEKAIELAVKKAAKVYTKKKMDKAQKKALVAQLAQEEEIRLMEEKVYKEMEAEYMKETGNTLGTVQKSQESQKGGGLIKDWRGQMVPRNFYNKNKPPVMPSFRSQGEAMTWSMSKMKPYHEAYPAKLKKWKQDNPAINKIDFPEITNAMDVMAKKIIQVDRSPVKLQVEKNLISQGMPKKFIKKEWQDSKIRKEVVKNAVVESFAPVIQKDLERRGMSQEEAEIVAVVSSDDLGKRVAETTGGGGKVLLIAGAAIASALLLG